MGPISKPNLNPERSTFEDQRRIFGARFFVISHSRFAESEMQSLCVGGKVVDKKEKRDMDCESEIRGPFLSSVAKTRGLAAGFLLVLVLVLVVCGAVCLFALRQVAIVRLETELLKLRMRDVEGRVDRCNALLLAVKTVKGAGERHQVTANSFRCFLRPTFAIRTVIFTVESVFCDNDSAELCPCRPGGYIGAKWGTCPHLTSQKPRPKTLFC